MMHTDHTQNPGSSASTGVPSSLRGRFPIVLRSRPKPSQSVRSSAATGVLASICPIIAEAPGTLRNQGAAHEMHTRPTQGGRSTMTRADQLREWASKCEQTSSAILIEQLQREAATRYRTMAEREINEPEVAAAPQQDLEILNLEGLVARQAEDITILRSALHTILGTRGLWSAAWAPRRRTRAGDRRASQPAGLERVPKGTSTTRTHQPCTHAGLRRGALRRSEALSLANECPAPSRSARRLSSRPQQLDEDTARLRSGTPAFTAATRLIGWRLGRLASRGRRLGAVLSAQDAGLVRPSGRALQHRGEAKRPARSDPRGRAGVAASSSTASWHGA